MNVPFVDLHRQYLRYKDELDAAMARVIAETAFISGPYAQKFEEEFAAWLGLTPLNQSSGGKERLGHISNPLGTLLRNALPGSGSLYCSSDGVRGRSAPVTNLSHNASFHA